MSQHVGRMAGSVPLTNSPGLKLLFPLLAKIIIFRLLIFFYPNLIFFLFFIMARYRFNTSKCLLKSAKTHTTKVLEFYKIPYSLCQTPSPLVYPLFWYNNSQIKDFCYSGAKVLGGESAGLSRTGRPGRPSVPGESTGT